MDWGQPAPFLPSFPPFLTGDKSPAGEISAGCLAVATVATRRSQRSQRSQPAGCDRCDRSDQGGRFVPAWVAMIIIEIVVYTSHNVQLVVDGCCWLQLRKDTYYHLFIFLQSEERSIPSCCAAVVGNLSVLHYEKQRCGCITSLLQKGRILSVVVVLLLLLWSSLLEHSRLCCSLLRPGWHLRRRFSIFFENSFFRRFLPYAVSSMLLAVRRGKKPLLRTTNRLPLL